jgi:BirA family biotin operon repressor/biotin-[acetyl-CoA-carboxylase] ligase
VTAVPRPEPLPGEFSDALARAAGRLGPFRREPIWYGEVPSTNDIAMTLGESGAAEGRLVIADAQSAGRGRHGRTWASPAGAGLYVSAILRPDADALPLLTIAAGLAIAEGMEQATGLSPRLKWPNDVYVGERKVAGMLAEGGSDFVVLGIGINVLPAAYPAEVAGRATSLEAELGRPVDRGLLLAECLAALASRYKALQRGESVAIIQAWRARAAGTLGRTVRWDAAGLMREGVAEDIDDTGALVVRTSGGPVRLISGEIQWS